MALQPGDTLHGRYKILSILGQGGMGSVYHALDTTLTIEVAIKENLFGSAEYAEQFKQEARLLASLRHPNLPRVTDYFVIENQGQYLVMDYIEGEDLKTRIEREGKIPVQEAVVIGLALCDALEYLHSQHPPVVHRDIKPGNVRITPKGHVFLVDFGLAKIGGSDQRTVTGAQAVTPGFSPPEQYGTSHTAPHSDIYSLGATLYMALAGEPPPDAFERALDHAECRPLDEINPEVPPALAQIIATAMALQAADRFRTASEMKAALLSLSLVPDQQKHLQDHAWSVAPPPAISKWRSDASRPLSGKTPNAATPPPPPPNNTRRKTRGRNTGKGKRNTTTGKKKTGSRGSAPPPPQKPPSKPKKQPAPQPPPRKRRWRAWLWLLLIVAALAGWYRYDPQGFLATAAAIEQRGAAWGQTYVLPRVRQLFPALAASLPATPANPTANPQAAQANATLAPATPTATATPPPSPTPSPTATPTPTNTPTPTITPTPAPTPLGNSGQLAFASIKDHDAQIWLVDTQGNLLRQLTDRPGGACQPAWTPDGQALAFTAPCQANTATYKGTQIYLLHLQSGKIEELTPPEWGGYEPAISPDGKYMVFTSARDGAPRLYLLDMQTKAIAPLLEDALPSGQATWAPDGRAIAFTALGTHRIWTVTFEPKTGEAGEPQPFSRSGNKRNAHPTWAANGHLLVYSQVPQGETIPYLVKTPFDQNGLNETPITVVGLAMREPTASPDGRWLALEGWKQTDHDIYIIPLDGSQAIQLTHTETMDFDPAWRPAPRP